MAARETSVLKKKTLVRFYLPVEYELALEKYMGKNGSENKVEAFDVFLSESESFQRELKEIREEWNY